MFQCLWNYENSKCLFYVYLTFPCPVVTLCIKLFNIKKNLSSTRTVYLYLNIEQRARFAPYHLSWLFFWTCSQNYENGLLASSCLSVHLSVRVEQFNSHWRDFHEIRELVEKNQVALRSDNNNGNFTWIHIHFQSYLAPFF